LESGTLKDRLKPINLSDLVHKLADAYQPLAEDYGAQLECTTDDEVTVHGDGELLQQLLANLLENALQHAGPNPTVKLEVHYHQQKACLQVSDNGPGIPAADRARVLLPFERLGGDAGNSGFGLALVAAIARLHKVELKLLDMQPGLGCQLLFPAA
jgi:signal transduction histidine kinase